jgi:DDE superfamily endonuclease
MRVARLKETYPTAKVELWCEDEHRLGLKPIIRKVWSPIGQRPLVEVHQRYEWSYLYSFVRPKTGEVHWLILPTVNACVFSMALEHFAREVGAGTRRRILLVLDRAGWHTAKEVAVPEGIHLEFLPPASPELQPSERRKAVALEQRRGGQPPLREDRGVGGGARGALCSSVQPARGHSFVHPLPLVASNGMRKQAYLYGLGIMHSAGL